VKGGLPLQHPDLEFHVQPVGQRFQGRLCCRGADEIDDIRGDATDGGYPGAASLGVGKQLDLIDDCDVQPTGKVRHLNGAGHMGACGVQSLLFSGYQADANALFLEPLVVLQRKEAQGR
jgi:hypothetical protein